MSDTVAAYDSAAPSFDRHRGLPAGVAEAVRAAVCRALEPSPRPRLLDLGAGSGRLGSAFVAAGDDYVGIDLSFGMLREFMRGVRERTPRLVQADGQSLPFRDGAFDAVMLIQIFGGLFEWRRLIEEARRVLHPTGALVTGRSVSPAQGIDAQMKQQLAFLLGEMCVELELRNVRNDVQRWLHQTARHSAHLVAAAWAAERTPRRFLARHRTGARFSTLPDPIKDESLRRLGAWAEERFGSLDAVSCERHVFELQIYRFQ